MTPQPSNRIVNWLRDFDPHMRIRWSAILGQFSVERKARISDNLRAAVAERCRMAFAPHETDSEHYDRIMKLRRLAHARLEAIKDGYDTVCSIPACAPADEAELIEFLRKKDPWRFGKPGDKNPDYVATQVANAERDEQMAPAIAAEKSVRREVRDRASELAEDVWRATGQRVPFGRGKAHAARDEKRKRKAA